MYQNTFKLFTSCDEPFSIIIAPFQSDWCIIALIKVRNQIRIHFGLFWFIV